MPRAQKSHPRVGRPEPGSAIAPVAWCKLGYPLYMTTILGARKVLSILGLAAPRFPRLKSLAYAGAIFDYSGEGIQLATFLSGSYRLTPSMSGMRSPDLTVTSIQPSRASSNSFLAASTV